jgi:DNA primase
MIARSTIEEVKNRMDIYDVVSDFVSLKRSGQNYKALSPFTNEKTASFYVVPSKGIFKDFSSGKGGDAITFVMEHEGLGYMEAIRYLAKKYGVELKEEARTEEDQAVQNERDSLYIVMNFARDYFKNLLTKNEEGQSIGLSYFRERGFNDRTIEKFDLGYSLNEWNHFEKHALSNGFSPGVLEKSGLVIATEEGRRYDRFRGRVMFPVHNLAGKVIAFGARILTKEKDQPKYINSPETEIYHKSHVLYGLYQARNEIRKHDFCYLVEGYTDVISLHQAGVENVVASSGTALTEEQIRLLRRFTENVTVLFDGDAAGIKAALRGIDLILKGGLNVRVVLLPDGEDPDSYSRKMGSTDFQNYLKANTRDFISFKIDLYSAGPVNDPIKKAEAIREIVTSIALIPDPIKRSVYIKETSDLLNIHESVLLTELNKILIRERKNREQERWRQEQTEPVPVIPGEQPLSKADPQTIVQLQERETVRLLVNYAEKQYEDEEGQHTVKDVLLHEVDDVEFSHPTYGEIVHLYKQAATTDDSIDSFYLMSNGSDDVKKLVAELLTTKYTISTYWRDKHHIIIPHEHEQIGTVVINNAMHLKFWLLQKEIEDNLARWKKTEKENGGNAKDIERFMLIHEQYKLAQRELADALGIIVQR